MKRTNPSLSICIPTFNRPEKFRNLIHDILNQITDEIEIVIRDDSTDKKTKRIFQDSISNLDVNYQYHNGERMGLDKANLFLLEKAKGEFIWWFSDDDRILEGAFSRVLDLIKNHKNLNFIWANFANEVLTKLAVDREDGFFYSKDEILDRLGPNLGLLSTYIIRRKIGIKGIKKAQKHIHGFSFASTSVVLFVGSEPGRSYFLRGPYVLNKPTTIENIKKDNVVDGEINNEAFKIFGIYYHDLISDFKGRFSNRSIKQMLKVNYSSVWRGMIVGWLGGWDTPKGKKFLMAKYYWSFPEFWIAIVLLILPKYIVSFLFRIYKIFYSHRKFIFLERFKN